MKKNILTEMKILVIMKIIQKQILEIIVMEKKIIVIVKKKIWKKLFQLEIILANIMKWI